MTANEKLRDSALSHAVFLAKYGEGLANKVLAILNSADSELVEKIAAGLSTDLGEKRLRQLLEEVRVLTDEVYSRSENLMIDELAEQARVTRDHEAGALEGVIPNYRASLPTPQVLATLVTTSPIDGYLLNSWTKQMSANRTARVEKAIRLGITQGETIDQMVQRVKGTRAQGYRDGILNISRNSAKTLVITANATIAARAREEVWKENSRVIKQVMWLSTLDTRTSSICQSRDGETFDLDSDHPKTPAHPRCRSLLIPITKSASELGIRGRDLSPQARASMDGQVPPKTTYGDWLGKQSEARQDQILGKARADLFRSGNLPFKDLYRTDGSFKTVAELREALNLPAAEPVLRMANSGSGDRPRAKGLLQPTILENERDEQAWKFVTTMAASTGREHLISYDLKDREGFAGSAEGNRDSVDIPPALWARMLDPNSEIIAHHNHPESPSLSKQDILVLTHPEMKGMKAVWAHGDNGSSFKAKRTRVRFDERIYNNVEAEVTFGLGEMMALNIIDSRQAYLMQDHMILLEVSRRGQILYSFELQGETKAVWEEHEEIFNQILERFK